MAGFPIGNYRNQWKFASWLCLKVSVEMLTLREKITTAPGSAIAGTAPGSLSVPPAAATRAAISMVPTLWLPGRNHTPLLALAPCSSVCVLHP